MPALTHASLKQRKFAREYVKNGGNATQAALEAYDGNYDSAQMLGHQNLKKPLVIDEINKLLDKTGFNDTSFIADKLISSINSGIGVKATNKDALQGINMLLKLNNAYPSNKSTSVKLTLNGQLSSENVVKVIDKLKGMSNKSNELIEDIS